MKLARPIQEALDEYFLAEWRGAGQPERVDVLLALLRISHRVPEARQAAEQIMGKPITVCPPSVPPWPPAQIAGACNRRVIRVAPSNPCAPKSDAHRRFGLMRAGMTLDSLASRGITHRDIRVWCQRGWMEVT